MKGERKSDQISNLDKKSKGDTSYMCIYIVFSFLQIDNQFPNIYPWPEVAQLQNKIEH